MVLLRQAAQRDHDSLEDHGYDDGRLHGCLARVHAGHVSDLVPGDRIDVPGVAIEDTRPHLPAQLVQRHQRRCQRGPRWSVRGHVPAARVHPRVHLSARRTQALTVARDRLLQGSMRDAQDIGQR